MELFEFGVVLWKIARPLMLGGPSYWSPPTALQIMACEMPAQHAHAHAHMHTCTHAHAHIHIHTHEHEHAQHVHVKHVHVHVHVVHIHVDMPCARVNLLALAL